MARHPGTSAVRAIPKARENLTDGVTLAAALLSAGFAPDRVREAAIDLAEVHAFLELHIAQGAVLERGGEQVGVVTAIAAPHDLRVVICGEAAHAGATPMALRRDAPAAAEVMLVLERLARASSSGTTVATVGVIRARPGAINVVPREVQLDIDVRDSDLAAREAVVTKLLQEVEAIADACGLTIDMEPIVVDASVQCAKVVVDVTTEACVDLGLTHRAMTSGAYHDAMIMAAKVPVGMTFVPSRRGLSHHPDEYTAPDQVDDGARVLAGTLRRLAAKPRRSTQGRPARGEAPPAAGTS